MTGPTVTPQAPQRRTLVVRRDVLLALGEVARGGDPGEAAGELAAQGLLGPDGRLTDIAVGTAAAIGSPLVTVQVSAVRSGGTRAGDLWVGRHRAVLHPVAGGPAPVVSVHRSLLPQLLLRTLTLGPRPEAQGEGFTASGRTVADACRGTGPAPWAGPAELPVLWRVVWKAEAGSGDISVLDLGPPGLRRPAGGSGDDLRWAPVSPSAVWTALGGLFAVALEDRPES